MPKEWCKGVKADTPLYDLAGFDIVWDLPIEEFHLLFEGLTKVMLDRMFVSSCTEKSRPIWKKLSTAYAEMAVFSETSRRTRPIMLHQFKGNSYKISTKFPRKAV